MGSPARTNLEHLWRLRRMWHSHNHPQSGHDISPLERGIRPLGDCAPLSNSAQPGHCMRMPIFRQHTATTHKSHSQCIPAFQAGQMHTAHAQHACSRDAKSAFGCACGCHARSQHASSRSLARPPCCPRMHRAAYHRVQNHAPSADEPTRCACSMIASIFVWYCEANEACKT